VEIFTKTFIDIFMAFWQKVCKDLFCYSANYSVVLFDYYAIYEQKNNYF